MWRRWRPQRKDVLFVVGILGISYEALFRAAERPTLLLLYAAMVGLPLVLRADEDRQSAKDEENR